LSGTKIRRINGSFDEVLRRHGHTSESTKHGELPGMSHRVGEWALQEAFFGGAYQFRSFRKVPCQVLEHRVKARRGQ
jgi:hypothetical protein